MQLTTMQTLKLSAIYKLCAGICTISELEEDEKLYVATATQRCMNTSKGDKERWAIDWKSLSLSKLSSKEKDATWHQIAELVERHPVPKFRLPKKTIPADWAAFPEMDETLAQHIDVNETPFQNVYNIYEEAKVVVHKRQIEKYTSKEATSSNVVVTLMKKLNPTVTQLAEIQKYINLSIRCKTKTKLTDLYLPDDLFALKKSLMKKTAKLYHAIDLEHKDTVVAELGLLGYTLATLTPAMTTQGDIAYYKKEDVISVEEAKEIKDKGITLDQSIVGMASSRAITGRPGQVFPYAGETDKTRLTPEMYLAAITEHFINHRDTITKYLETPKLFYIKKESIDSTYEWDHEAIMLDIYYNEGLAVHPDTFYRTTKKFQGLEPVVWLEKLRAV